MLHEQILADQTGREEIRVVDPQFEQMHDGARVHSQRLTLPLEKEMHDGENVREIVRVDVDRADELNESFDVVFEVDRTILQLTGGVERREENQSQAFKVLHIERGRDRR